MYSMKLFLPDTHGIIHKNEPFWLLRSLDFPSFFFQTSKYKAFHSFPKQCNLLPRQMQKLYKNGCPQNGKPILLSSTKIIPVEKCFYKQFPTGIFLLIKIINLHCSTYILQCSSCLFLSNFCTFFQDIIYIRNTLLPHFTSLTDRCQFFLKYVIQEFLLYIMCQVSWQLGWYQQSVRY